MQQSCFLILFLIPFCSSNYPCSQLLIITHHIQSTLRNNNWSSVQQHIQWRECQRVIQYKMFQMHLISSIFTFFRVKILRFYTYPEKFISKYFTLTDLLRKIHFHGFYPCQMTAIIKWIYVQKNCRESGIFRKNMLEVAPFEKN